VLGSKIGLEALQALISGAKRVDLGDMTRPVTGARRDALKAMLPKAAKAGDDWGWKGGKPGELTGGEYQKRLDDLYERYNYGEGLDYERFQNAEDALRDEMFDTLENQLAKSSSDIDKSLYNDFNDDMDKFAMDMSTLEQADIPREWTGKVWPVIQKKLDNPFDYVPPALAQQVSDAMRTLSNDQRKEFLDLLPEWTESLEDLANAVRML
jgi:hypothetical protein